MKPGGTLMSSLLFNTALVLLSTNAVIQFCQQAFSLYASNSAISEIWGNQARNLYKLSALSSNPWQENVSSQASMLGVSVLKRAGRRSATITSLDIFQHFSSMNMRQENKAVDLHELLWARHYAQITNFQSSWGRLKKHNASSGACIESSVMRVTDLRSFTGKCKNWYGCADSTSAGHQIHLPAEYILVLFICLHGTCHHLPLPGQTEEVGAKV